MSRLALAASLSIASLFVLGTGAAHAETAKVSSRIAELRVKPSGDARSKLKLGRNRSVDVLSKSDDGQWVKIRAEVQRGEDPVTFEGWIAAVDLGIKGASAPATSGSGDSGWGDEGSSSSSSSTASAGDLDWATETPAAEPAPVESWEAPVATESAPPADAWGSGGSDSEVPAATSDSGSSGWGDDSGSSSESESSDSDW